VCLKIGRERVFAANQRLRGKITLMMTAMHIGSNPAAPENSCFGMGTSYFQMGVWPMVLHTLSFSH